MTTVTILVDKLTLEKKLFLALVSDLVNSKKEKVEEKAINEAILSIKKILSNYAIREGDIQVSHQVVSNILFDSNESPLISCLEEDFFVSPEYPPD